MPVLAKCEHMNSGDSITDRIALAIVDDAERSAVLQPGMTLIEATSGNTSLPLTQRAGPASYDFPS